ncbi:hypothetical protein HB779_05665 [Phyllobacterium sp. 628]|uniref:hypothetical protein n=1 Tax=Phyllobacterium sp. 628 TaxID=2718938 RepID=UPI001662595D|nr:hypothetical protein [Phyllobacterium sp. 628]QND51444.1 hypothetical protein HB779_05665 [Phyllobacterium sp. 628]
MYTVFHMLRTYLLSPVRVSAIIFAVAVLSYGAVTWAQAQTANRAPKEKPQIEETRPADIDRSGILILIRSTLIALDQANKTGNYTVFRDLAASDFRVNDASKLAEIFAKQRSDEIDLGGTLVLEPQPTIMPQTDKNGLLHLKGFFPSVPRRSILTCSMHLNSNVGR